MNGFRALAAAAAVVLLMPAAFGQWADSDKPPVLTPNDYPPVADGPPPQAATQAGEQTGGQAQDDASAPPQALPGSQPQSPVSSQGLAPPPSVEVGTLGSAEGPAAGLLDSNNGGLGQGIWNGSPRADVETLLLRAPLASADPALRALTLRVVLTKADAPIGPAPHAFTTLRIEKLLDGGLIQDAGALAAQASVPDDPDFARAQADALLVADRAADVCSDKTSMRLTAPDPFWLQLRVYCASVGGDQPTADLTQAVLAAQGHDDKAFDVLLGDVLNHTTTAPGPIAKPTAIHIFLLQQAGLPVTDAIAAKMGTAENLLAMRDPRNALPVRIAAASRIAWTGALNADELKKMADAEDIPLSRIANAAAQAPRMSFFDGQTALRRAAELEQQPDNKLALMVEALNEAEHEGLLPLAARFQSDVLASLRPQPANADARLIARALLLAGLPDVARLWAKPGDVMLSVADMAAPGPARDAELSAALGNYAVELTKNPPDPDADRSYKALILGLADVLGLPMPAYAKAQAGALEAQNWGGMHPGSAVMQQIEQASGRPERKGEALLLILDQLRGMRDLSPDVTVEFVRLLGAMDLPQAARAVALEAAMLYVPPPPPQTAQPFTPVGAQ